MTEPTTLDPAAKERVVAALVAHESADRDALAAEAGVEEDAAIVDPDQVRDDGDRALADEAAQMTALTERSEQARRSRLDHLGTVDFSPTEVVRPGAVVGFGGYRYVVGVVADSFECDGETYEGIAEDAPAFAVLSGLRAGDTFTLAGQEQRLDLVG